MVFDRERAVANDGLEYIHLNHPLIRRIVAELTQTSPAAITHLRVRRDALSSQVEIPTSAGLLAVYLLRMTDHAGLARSELIPVFLDTANQSYPRLAQALLEISADQVETAHIPLTGMKVEQLGQQAQTLAEKLAADDFSEAQLQHAQNLETEQHKVEKYYREQEGAVKQIAIENIRLAKQRELLERRHTDLKSLDDRRVLVPNLSLIGMAFVAI